MHELRYPSPMKVQNTSFIYRSGHSQNRPLSANKQFNQSIGFSGYQNSSGAFNTIASRNYVPIKSTTIVSPFPTVVTSEIRQLSPQKHQIQMSPPKYVIHNPPQHLKISPLKNTLSSQQFNQLISSKKLQSQIANTNSNRKTGVLELSEKNEIYDSQNLDTPINLLSQETNQSQEALIRQNKYQQQRILEYEKLLSHAQNTKDQQDYYQQQLEEMKYMKEEVEQELQKALEELKNKNNEIDQLQTRNIQLEKENEDYLTQIQQLSEQLKQKEQENDKQLKQIMKQNQVIVNQSEQIVELENKIDQLEQDQNTWKTKFVEINREYHATQEKLTLTETELQQMKSKETRQARLSQHSEQSRK